MEVMSRFIVLIMMMVLWVYTYLQLSSCVKEVVTLQLFFYVNSQKQLKKRKRINPIASVEFRPVCQFILNGLNHLGSLLWNPEH